MSDEARDIMDEFDAENAPTPDYVPETDEQFEYRVRALLAAQAHAEHLREWKAEQLHTLAAKFDARIRTDEDTIEHHRALIEEGLRRVEPVKGKRSVKVPSATIFTVTRTEFDWPADKELVSWAIAQPVDGLVRVKESPDKTAIKAYVKETGDIPPGLEVREVESVTIREM